MNEFNYNLMYFNIVLVLLFYLSLVLNLVMISVGKIFSASSLGSRECKEGVTGYPGPH